MNDTTREVGTTLGVAVLGSILSSGYTSNLGGAVTSLPAATRQVAQGSLAGALGVAHQIGGTQGAAIVEAAKSAWADGLRLSMVIGAGIVLVAAIISARYLPGKPGGVSNEAIEYDGFDDEFGSASPSRCSATSAVRPTSRRWPSTAPTARSRWANAPRSPTSAISRASTRACSTASSRSTPAC